MTSWPRVGAGSIEMGSMIMLTRMIRLLAALTAGLLVLGLGIVAGPAGAVEPAAIKGQVLSAMDPIGYAKVTVFNATTGAAVKSATTDGEGYYLITGLPPGRIKVRATKPGYLASWASGAATRAAADVYTLHPGQTLEQSWDAELVLYLDLTPGAVITGSIMGFSYSPTVPWDDPLPGVTVSAFDAVTGKPVGSAITDITGEFRIGMLRAGNVKVRASKPGWLTTWAHDRWTRATAEVFAVHPYVPADLGVVAIYAPAGIRGSVMLDDEPVVTDVTVTVFDAATGKALRSVVDDDGYFQIEGLPPVPVKVRATGPFYTTAWANWQTTRAAATVFTLVAGQVFGESGGDGAYLNVIRTGNIRGQVLGDSHPLRYAKVTVFDAATGVVLRSGRADGSGHYRIDKIPVGFAGKDIKVRASKAGWISSWANGRTSMATADTFHLIGRQILQQTWDPPVLYLDLRRTTS